MMKIMKHCPLKGIIAAIATLFTGSWASDALQGGLPFKEFWTFPPQYAWVVRLAIIAFFIFSFLMLYQYRISFFPVKSLSRAEVVPHKCLVIPVSTPYPLNKADDVLICVENGAYKISVQKEGTMIEVPQKDITHDIQLLEGTRWSWQQMLRCIEPHKDRIKHIYLIGSPCPDGEEKKGSYNSLCAAEFLINHYLKNSDVKVRKHPFPVDFEDFDGLTNAFNKAIAEFKLEGISEKHIIIDITGGQKPASIAGAIVTLDKNVTFQYVQPKPDKSGKYKVLAYDAIIQPPTF